MNIKDIISFLLVNFRLGPIKNATSKVIPQIINLTVKIWIAKSPSIKENETSSVELKTSSVDLKVYDSKCLFCHPGNESCFVRENVCVDNGKCFNQEEMIQEDNHRCRICGLNGRWRNNANGSENYIKTSLLLSELDHYSRSQCNGKTHNNGFLGTYQNFTRWKNWILWNENTRYGGIVYVCLPTFLLKWDLNEHFLKCLIF